MSDSWYAQAANALGQVWRFDVIESSAYPDGTRIELVEHDESSARPVGWRASAHLNGDAVVAIELCESVAAKLPPVWFAGWTADSDAGALPPAAELMAFSGRGQRPGSLVESKELPSKKIELAEQLGAVRWFPVTGEVDQLYVARSWRRCGIGTALVYSASVLSGARGWRRVWSNGERTQLGEDFRNAASWRRRSADLTYLSPPMTPPE